MTTTTIATVTDVGSLLWAHHRLAELLDQLPTPSSYAIDVGHQHIRVQLAHVGDLDAWAHALGADVEPAHTTDDGDVYTATGMITTHGWLWCAYHLDTAVTP